MDDVFIDTNVIIRFITGEPQVQAALVAEFLQRSDRGEICIHLNPIVVAEVVFVLTGKVYTFEKAKVCDALKTFITNPAFVVHDLDCLLTALDWFNRHPVDFADAYIAASAHHAGASVVTFDRDFKHFTDVTCHRLGAST